MDITQALPLLGGLSPRQFMKRHWQKRPLLVRAALPGFRPLLARSELFPAELEEGMTFEGLPQGGNPDAPSTVLYTVTEIYPEHVVLDGNHPLAGIAIRLHLKVQGVREATEEEVGRGSAGTGFFTVPRVAPGGTTLH